jgi:hypothetical protein
MNWSLRFPDHAEQVRRQCRMMMFAERLGTNPHPMVARLREPPSLMRLDDYEIHRLIGRGGMGFVYEASKPGLSRRLAIKVLADQASTSRSLPKRFALEAEAASRLHHPNIVPVFDYGEFQGLQFLAMLYIDGCNLEQVIRHLILKKSGASIPKANVAPEECLAAVDSWEKDCSPGRSGCVRSAACSSAWHDSSRHQAGQSCCLIVRQLCISPTLDWPRFGTRTAISVALAIRLERRDICRRKPCEASRMNAAMCSVSG